VQDCSHFAGSFGRQFRRSATLLASVTDNFEKRHIALVIVRLWYEPLFHWVRLDKTTASD
jgi:hypothetical protein